MNDIERYRARRLERLKARGIYRGGNMEVKTVNISELRPYGNNPRVEGNVVDAIKESVEKCTYVSPIIVDENNGILAGHMRYKALYELGYEDIPVVEVKGLSDEQKKKFRLLDNKTAEIADWDLDKLIVELDGLELEDFFGDEVEKMAGDILKDNEPKKEKKLVVCPQCGRVIQGLIDTEELEYDG